MEKKLNKDQIKAIKHKTGPLLIIAGAGTGKTTVITERIKYLISKNLAKPEEILALTFTEKASREMEVRVDEVMPYGLTQMWISTFHSFCDRILRDEALNIGLDPRFHLMSGSETIQLIRRNLFNFDLNYFRPLGNPTKFVTGLIDHFSRLQDEDITPSDYMAWIKKQKPASDEEKLDLEKYKELAKAYQQYEELKIKESLMDYGDLIVKTLQLFRDRKNILAKYENKFKYILVDEFQDTNFAQSQLVYLLASKHKNITVVGDDDQSIYRFRGAAISNILQFSKVYPDAKKVVLTQNYRSNQEILDSAYRLIQHNNPDRLEVVEKINKKLVGIKRFGEVNFIHEDRAENEAERVCQIILEHIKQDKYNFSDFAILVRANNHAESFIRALQRAGIPYQFLGPGRLFKQPEVMDLVAYLNVVANIEDSQSMYRILSMDEFDIAPIDVMKITNFAKNEDISLFEACEIVTEIKVSDKTKQKVKKIISGITNHVNLSKKQTAGQIMFLFLEENNLLDKLFNPDTADADKKAKNVAKFFDKLKTYEAEHEDSSVSTVVDWIELSSELGESPAATDTDWTNINAVNILTIHSSKGLEFPVVFLVNMVSQRFPSMERSEQIPLPEQILKEVLPTGDFHLQEERRLAYVGMTRAKDYLYLTAADFYGSQSDGKRQKKISPFIYESFDEIFENKKQEIQIPEQLSLLSFISNTQEENKKLIRPKIDYLSYSQIETFETCPLHYKLKYLVGIPTQHTPSESLGISVHGAIKDFYELIKLGKKASEKLLLEQLEKNWITTGYKNKKFREKNWERAQNYMKGYFKNAFNEKLLPTLQEQKFVLNLEEEGERRLQIGGIIDRVDEYKEKIEIIDYKTGEKVPTQKEVDNNTQLTLYALAMDQDPKDITLSLYYFENQVKISTKRTQKQLDEFRHKLFEIRHEIEESDFGCSGNFFCKICDYKQFCQVDIDKL